MIGLILQHKCLIISATSTIAGTIEPLSPAALNAFETKFLALLQHLTSVQCLKSTMRLSFNSQKRKIIHAAKLRILFQLNKICVLFMMKAAWLNALNYSHQFKEDTEGSFETFYMPNKVMSCLVMMQRKVI